MLKKFMKNITQEIISFHIDIIFLVVLYQIKMQKSCTLHWLKSTYLQESHILKTDNIEVQQVKNLFFTSIRTHSFNKCIQKLTKKFVRVKPAKLI